MLNKYFLALLLWLTGVSAFAQGAGDFVSFQKSATTLTIQGTTGILKIQAPDQGIFKIQTITGGANSDTSYTVSLRTLINLPDVNTTTGSLLLDFGKCDIEITKKPLKVALRAAGKTKIRDARGPSQTRDSVRFEFDIDPADVFHGAGARPFGPDLNRKAFDFYNTAEYAYYDQLTALSQSFNVPFIIASHRYGILFDSDRPGSMRLYVGAVDSTRMTMEAASTGQWTYYLINGDSNDEILEKYTLLTGRQPLPPRWAFGYIQSKSGYENESEATVAISKLQSEGFPVDALALDSKWFGGDGKQGNFVWDAKNWPDAASMVSKLRQKGVKTVLLTDPYVAAQSLNFRAADSLSLLARKPGSGTYLPDIPGGSAGLFDVFKPATRNWINTQYNKLAAQGIEGWWTDRTEPQFAANDILFTVGSGMQTHNLYGHVWSLNLYELQERIQPGKRLFNLTRSGWAGSQRFGILPWSGQVARYWAGLKVQIPVMVQSGMSGLAYMHSDAGGFATMSDKPEKDEELDLRWFQMATFSPILRVNGQRSNVEPFNLAEPFYSTVKRYARIRYQLLPYLYSLAWMNSVSGRPICMPMDYFAQNRNLGNVGDQYFFGENFLIAPVLLHGMPSRKVILPSGKWFDFWTYTLQSGSEVFPKLTVDNIPVYVKAGSFVPLATSAKMQSTDQYLSDSLTVKFFQDISVPKSAFTFFHDDGNDPTSLQTGKYELIDLMGNVFEDSIRIDVARKQEHHGALARRVMLFEIENLTSAPISVSLNGKEIPVVYLSNAFQNESAYYDLANRQLKIRTAWECKTPLRITVARDGLSVVTGTETPKGPGSLAIFPNPLASGDEVSVHAKVPKTAEYVIEICSPTGGVVMKKSLGKYEKGQTIHTSIRTGGLHGSYVLRLKDSDNRSYSKILMVE